MTTKTKTQLKTTLVLRGSGKVVGNFPTMGRIFAAGQTLIHDSVSYVVVSDKPSKTGRTLTVEGMGETVATPCGRRVRTIEARSHLDDCRFCPADPKRVAELRMVLP